MKKPFIMMVLLWMAPVTVLAQENLLTNPDFESDFGPNNRWRAAAVPPVVFERTDAQAYSGSWSGRAGNRSEQWHGPFYGLSADGLLGDGGFFQIRVHVKADDPVGQQQVRLILQIDDGREACPAELPLNIEWCFCYDVDATNKSCLFGADRALSDADTWVELEWTGPVEFIGDVNFYMFQIDTLEGPPYPDLYIDNAYLANLTTILRDRFEAQ